MGSYLNPGTFSFRGSLRSKIYVDKSELIARTNEVGYLSYHWGIRQLPFQTKKSQIFLTVFLTDT